MLKSILTWFNNGFILQWTTIAYNNTWTLWTYPIAFPTFVCGFNYVAGIRTVVWDSNFYMDNCKADYIGLTNMNISCTGLNKDVYTVPGFAMVYGF